MMRSLILFLPLMAGLATAQDAPVASLRLLALGQMPPFRQEIRDGVRRELDPPEGSLPPRMLEAGLPAAAKLEAKAPTFGVRLSVPTQPVKVAPVDGKVKLRDPAQTGDWAVIPCPAGAKTLAVLWRQGDSWKKPQVLALPDLAPDHDPRVFRFVNVAPQTVGVVFGEKRFQLEAGKTVSLALPEGARAVSVAVLFAGPGASLKPCFSALAEPRIGTATQYFIHRADGETPRRPVEVTPVTGPLAPP